MLLMSIHFIMEKINRIAGFLTAGNDSDTKQKRDMAENISEWRRASGVHHIG